MNQSDKIRAAIAGYGNLGKGVELAIRQNPDIELVAVFTRRDPGKIGSSAPVFNVSQVENFRSNFDVMILCGGSATDLPEMGPKFSSVFNTVDSYDTHARIPEYFASIDSISRKNKTLSLISTGWNPGLFSLARLLGQCVLPEGKDYTFWGKGVSQGHSDVIHRLPGVMNSIQYTVPVESALERVHSGENPDLKTS
mgnify:CR=1 FL=1